MKKHLPNALTCLNLLCGCLGIVCCFGPDLYGMESLKTASYFIYAGALFDFLDGFAARWLKVSSEIGKQLDSLADMVTFGLLPSMILFRILSFQSMLEDSSWQWSCLAAFCVAVFSALRLAKFNIDTRQSSSFIGVPTPANAVLISSFPFIFSSDTMLAWQHPVILAIGSVLLSLLLVSELPLFALKLKSLAWKDNAWKYALIGISVVLLPWLGMLAVPLLFTLYLLFSFAEHYFSKKQTY
ncbi:MAG: CDP-diacylglycerol--serine O-phosphatidyltransferase [Cytophagaceae bacterium]|jgi:CDP-diacylglycerol--serine O-phosphatidyltransferase|nr:CDP-diacylglycerol--serine O-phosphatidyltransferase [Cytophagaceae bacterium]